MSNTKSYKYHAFISYSHQDEKWGKWIEKKLHTYSIPKEYIGKENYLGLKIPEKLNSIFRDRTILPAKGKLSENIKNALRESQYLIVICSPNSAKSKYVNDEIVMFKQEHGDDRILPIIISGEPNVDLKKDWTGPEECFPKGLKYHLDQHGNLTDQRVEPVCGDARKGKDGKWNALLKIIAGLLGINYSDLINYDIQLRQRTNRIRAAIASVIFAVVITLGIFSLVQWKSAEKQRDEVRKTLSHSDFLVGCEKEETGDIYTAMAYWARSLRVDSTNQLSSCRITSSLLMRSWCFPMTEPLKHEDDVTHAEFSPDGKYVVTASWDNTARIWDAKTGKPLTEPLKHEKWVYHAEFSPDGKYVVTASWDNTARIWDVNTGEPLTEPLKHENIVTHAEFSPDGKYVVTASYDNTARIWDAKNGKPLTEPLKHEKWVYHAEFSPDGKYVVTASRDNTARIWDAKSGKPLTEPLKHENDVEHAAFSPDGKYVVTASDDNTARIWDAKNGKPLTEPLKHENGVYHAEFSPDGKYVVTASGDNTARIWDVKTGKPLTEPLKHENGVYHAEFSPDGKYVVTASWDNTARIWDAKTGKPLTAPLKHENTVYHAAFSRDGKYVVTASYDNTARIWDAKNGKPLTEPLKHENSVYHAEFSPDGKYVVTASSDNTARIWDAKTGKPLTEPLKHKYAVTHAEFSCDGKYVVTASEDYTARIWDAKTGKPLTEPLKHEYFVNYAAFSRDGKYVVTASVDYTARIWDVKTGKPLTEPLKHENSVTHAVFSPDGKYVVTASYDNTARIWDAKNGKPLTEPLKHEKWVYHAEFSRDGKYVVTASEDYTARIWDVNTGKPLTEPLKHKYAVTHAEFSCDGKYVVTASEDYTARIWDVKTGKPLTEPLKHENSVTHAAFSPDGKYVVTTSQDATARIWDIGYLLTKHNISHLILQSEIVSDKHLNERSILMNASSNQYLKYNRLKEQARNHQLKDKITEFILTDPLQRNISPFSNISTKSYIYDLIVEGTETSLQEAYHLGRLDSSFVNHINLKRKIRELWNQANIQFNHNSYKQYLDLFNNASVEIDSLNKLDNSGKSYLTDLIYNSIMTSNAYRFLNRYDDAEKFLLKADSLINHLKNRNELYPKEDLENNINTYYAALFGSKLINSFYRNDCHSAIKYGEKAISYYTELIWIYQYLAHSYLFNDNYDKAKAIYIKYKDEKVNEQQSFKEAVLNDFAELRKKGITHEKFNEIETLLKN